MQFTPAKCPCKIHSQNTRFTLKGFPELNLVSELSAFDDSLILYGCIRSPKLGVYLYLFIFVAETFPSNG